MASRRLWAPRAGVLACFASLAALGACSGGDESNRFGAGGSAGLGAGGAGGEGGSTVSSTVSTASAGGAGAGGDSSSGANLRIVVLSDLNGSYGSTSYGAPVHGAVNAAIDDLEPDLILITGDMVAGQQAGLDYQAMWAGFHDAVTEPLHAVGIPLAVTPGNHDASGYEAYAAERAIFVDQWSEQSRVPPVTFVDDSLYPLRYSFTYRGAFFLSLDATTIGPLDQEQLDWVDAQLEAAGEVVKIAFGHVPLHAVTQGRETETLHDTALESVFQNRDLTLYLSGHHHGYYPGARNGLRLVSMPCLGSGPRKLIGSNVTTARALLQIDVSDDAISLLEAWQEPAFTLAIDRETLPGELSYQGDTVTRDDLAGF